MAVPVKAVFSYRAAKMAAFHMGSRRPGGCSDGLKPTGGCGIIKRVFLMGRDAPERNKRYKMAVEKDLLCKKLLMLVGACGLGVFALHGARRPLR